LPSFLEIGKENSAQPAKTCLRSFSVAVLSKPPICKRLRSFVFGV
jgi:hypothetical protein